MQISSQLQTGQQRLTSSSSSISSSISSSNHFQITNKVASARQAPNMTAPATTREERSPSWQLQASRASGAPTSNSMSSTSSSSDKGRLYDQEACRQQTSSSQQQPQQDEKGQRERSEQQPAPRKKPLFSMLPEQFYLARGASYREGMTWVEVERVIYDVTNFKHQHPGGSTILEQFHGTDASEAFRRARHSAQAKLKMQALAVGSVFRRQETYRIFEEESMPLMLVDVGYLLLLFLGLVLTWPWSVWNLEVSTDTSSTSTTPAAKETSAMFHVVLGLTFGLAAGCVAAVLKFAAEPSKVLHHGQASHWIAAAWLLQSVGVAVLMRR
mmetsp:Transcript_80448/g.176378  ORF Transcript_80448/g.176378 Transcript_80448/m.176378 type:complete len:327 (-) Transcript_80448:9-989(-)